MMMNAKTLIILIILFLFIFGSCREKVTSPEVQSTGLLMTYEGCKSFAATSGTKSASHSSNAECFEYQYNGQGQLALKHINSGFNCCPEKIDADISLSGGLIYIKEREKAQGCFCRCLFDIDYQINDLKPGTYTIEIKGPYVETTDESLRFDVELYGQCSGTFCVVRTHYPWAE